MRVKCVADLPTLPQSRRLGRRYMPGSQAFPVVVGTDYIVYGLDTYPEGTWVYLETELGYLASVPIVLFELIEASVPNDWSIRVTSDGDVTVGPEALFREHFLDDLSEQLPHAVRQFVEMKRALGRTTDP